MTADTRPEGAGDVRPTGQTATHPTRDAVWVEREPPRQVAVVFNPTKAPDADARRAEVVDALVAAGLPEPAWLETTVDDPGTVMLQGALDKGSDLVVACGGDGTVRACITALAGTDVPLAVVPAGTGNLLARNFAIPLDLAEAARVAGEGLRRRIDVVQAGEHTFAIMAGMGFDAQMMRDAPEPVKARVGWLAYGIAALKHLREPAGRFLVSVDGRPAARLRGRSVLVGNVGELPGRLKVLAEALCDDGYLDVAVLRPESMLDWARLASRLARKKPAGRQLPTQRGRTVTVRSRRPLPFQVDGDVVGTVREFSAEIRPQALTLCVPRDQG